MLESTHRILAAGQTGERRWFGTASAILAAAGFILVVLTAFEAVRWAIPVLPNEPPRLDPYGYGRSGLTAVLSLVLLIILARRAPASQSRAMSVGEHVMSVLALALLLAFLMMFLISPKTFGVMSLEDGAIEWISALLPIAASGLVLWRGAWLLRQAQGEQAVLWAGLALILGAGILFALGMEEISWMQRIFGWTTPQVLSGNIQGELNLHNLATNQVGTLHKIAGFAFLVFLPFLQATAPGRMMAPVFTQLIPSRSVALVSAPLAAFNYNGWDFLPMQMATYLTVGIVSYFGLRAWRDRRPAEAVICACLTIAITAAQLFFILRGDQFTRMWDVTEYKELFIALGLFLWAAEMFHRLRTSAAATAVRS